MGCIPQNAGCGVGKIGNRVFLLIPATVWLSRLGVGEAKWLPTSSSILMEIFNNNLYPGGVFLVLLAL